MTSLAEAAKERAYEAIRASIIRGEYANGAHLNAADIADALGISRTPVREAFSRLQAEGLVTLIANRGAFVTPWTRDDLDEVFGLRVLLESHAASIAAQRITPENLAMLRDLAERMEHAYATQPPNYLKTIMELNAAFHRGVVSASGQRRLSIIMVSIVDTPLIMRTFTVYSDADMRRSMAHHRELVDACAAGDPDWAASVMRSHLLAAHQVMLGHRANSAPPSAQAFGGAAPDEQMIGGAAPDQET